MSRVEFQEWICDLERSISDNVETYDRHSSIAAGFTLEHTTTPGMYIRELTMTAGSLIFSKIHLKTHPFMVVKGKVSVYNGDKVETITAPYKGVTLAGTKRVLYIHEETTWVTFHPTNITDLDALDKNGVITCNTFEEYEKINSYGGELCLLSQQQ